MPQLSKILVKVIRNDEWKWVHFCYVYSDLYDEFFKYTECEKSEFGAFLSMWAQGDFNEKMGMSTFEDIQRLRYLVDKKYKDEYSELYALSKEENPSIHGWMRMWVSQHMRIEVAARKGD
jgi:SRSO17 transposase